MTFGIMTSGGLWIAVSGKGTLETIILFAGSITLKLKTVMMNVNLRSKGLRRHSLESEDTCAHLKRSFVQDVFKPIIIVPKIQKEILFIAPTLFGFSTSKAY